MSAFFPLAWEIPCVGSCIKNYKEPITNKNAVYIFNNGVHAQANTGEGEYDFRKKFPMKASAKSIHQKIKV